MGSHVLGFQEIHDTQVGLVGGKGANLGELSRIEGIRVPAGFCVTTDAFTRIMAQARSMDDRLDRLSRLKPDEWEAIRALSAKIRATLEGIAIPDDLATAITRRLAQLGDQAAYAVRSSATAEDLPTASFAGQQDTYLNVVGAPAILAHISRCWATRSQLRLGGSKPKSKTNWNNTCGDANQNPTRRFGRPVQGSTNRIVRSPP